MKRRLPVFLGAIAGLIALPIVMWLYMLFVHRVVDFASPQFLGSGPLAFKFYLRFFTTSLDGRIILATGAMLGAWSMAMCRQRSAWQNLGCALCSGIAALYFGWGLWGDYQFSVSAPASLRGYFLPIVLFRSPILLWTLALLVFAVLSRRTASGKAPLLSTTTGTA